MVIISVKWTLLLLLLNLKTWIHAKPSCPDDFTNTNYKQELKQDLKSHCLTRLSREKSDGNPTNISVAAIIENVAYVDTQEIFKSTVMFIFVWTDPRLQWQPASSVTNQKETYSYFPRDKIWIPDLTVYNAVDVEFVGDLRKLGTNTVQLYPNGKVKWVVTARIKVACRLHNIKDFPFDKNKCIIILGPIVSDAQVFRFDEIFIRKQKIFKEMTQTIDWSLRNTSSAIVQHDTLKIEFDLKRKHFYYYFLIIIPFEMISVLAAVIFIPEDTGAKASVSVAMLLSMTIYILISSQSTPKSMNQIHWLGNFLLFQMGIVILFAFINIIDLKSYLAQPKSTETDNEGDTKSDSKCLKVYTFFHDWKIVILTITYFSCLAINWKIHF